MAGIPEATPIVLTADEQAELEELTRSTKTEYRLRQRAQIVLLAAKGVASRAIGRKVGCTTGTASKWRVRYARGLSAIGRVALGGKIDALHPLPTGLTSIRYRLY